MDSSDIDSESLQAVKSLRSKFEKLTLDTSTHIGHSSRSSMGNDQRPRLAGGSSSQRWTSNPQLDSSVLDSGTDTCHLRTSSSSSDLRSSNDLKILVKRAPPPPPPSRSTKVVVPNPSPSPSPSPSFPLSPALRPVSNPLLKSELKDLEVPPSVSALRNKL